MVHQDRLALGVAALRSGAFKQGRGTLRDKYDEFCCLGVLTEIAIANGCVVQHHMDGDLGVWIYGGQGCVLPEPVQHWYGFDDADPELIDTKGLRLSAIRANDLLNLSFTEIADAFERTYATPEVTE
jgi:hypothetical protein